MCWPSLRHSLPRHLLCIYFVPKTTLRSTLLEYSLLEEWPSHMHLYQRRQGPGSCPSHMAHSPHCNVVLKVKCPSSPSQPFRYLRLPQCPRQTTGVSCCRNWELGTAKGIVVWGWGQAWHRMWEGPYLGPLSCTGILHFAPFLRANNTAESPGCFSI